MMTTEKYQLYVNPTNRNEEAAECENFSRSSKSLSIFNFNETCENDTTFAFSLQDFLTVEPFSTNVWKYSSPEEDDDLINESPLDISGNYSSGNSSPSSCFFENPFRTTMSECSREKFGSLSNEHERRQSTSLNSSPITASSGYASANKNSSFDSLTYSPMFELQIPTQLHQKDRNDESVEVTLLNAAKDSFPRCSFTCESASKDSNPKEREPDKDAIKMFVGQIPKSWNENEFRKYFEKFGEIFQLNILRDKITNDSKGCGFVTYYTRDAAIEAQRNLHDKEILPGMTHCIQMKPADSENRKERKLFVGMLPKRMTEEEVKQCFSKFGPIEECTVLKNLDDNSSKGCAFVTFTKKSDAQSAIRHMNNQIIDTAKGTPLVVKNADSQKDKETKRHQLHSYSNTSTMNNTCSNSTAPFNALNSTWPPVGGSAAGTQTCYNIQSDTSNSSSNNLSSWSSSSPVTAAAASNSAAALSAAATLNCLNQINAAANILGNTNQFNSQQQSNVDLSQAAASLLHATNMSSNPIGNLLANQLASAAALAQQQQQTNQLNSILNATGAFNAVVSSNNHLTANQNASCTQPISGHLSNNAPVTAASALQQLLTAQQLQQAVHLNSNSLGLPLFGANSSSPLLMGSSPTSILSGQVGGRSIRSSHDKQREGPDGSNLFIYHLPPDFTDHDLRETFMPFGNVISAKVFIDKNTNLSKCFGFVSYDNPTVAQVAIKAMDGCQVGNKKLKVEHKKSKRDSALSPSSTDYCSPHKHSNKVATNTNQASSNTTINNVNTNSGATNYFTSTPHSTQSRLTDSFCGLSDLKCDSSSPAESFYAQHKLISDNASYSLLSESYERSLESLWK